MLRSLGEGVDLEKTDAGNFIHDRPNSLAEELTGSPKAIGERETDWVAIKNLLARECKPLFFLSFLSECASN